MGTENTTSEETTVQDVEFDFSTEYSLQTDKRITDVRPYSNTVRLNPKRRKITIIAQTANVMEAEVEHYPADVEKDESDGTPITAELIGEFHDVIEQADQNAKSSFNMTQEVADKVATYLEQTNNNIKILENQITQQQGTKVTENGEYVADFDADKKLNVATYNSDKLIEDAKISALENKEIVKNVVYDTSTNTFTF